MSTGSAVGIFVGTVMLVVVMRRSTQIFMWMLPQLATGQPSSGRHWHVDVEEAHRHA